jgi:hypothetical protein
MPAESGKCNILPLILLLEVDMKRSFFIAGFVAAALALNVFAQTRRHDQIMKDVGATFEKLKASLDARNADALQDAAKLQGLFKETEQFWAPFNTKGATDAAKGAQTALEAMSGSIKANNFQQALTTYTRVGQYCAACHSAHRVQTADQSYRIKP